MRTATGLSVTALGAVLAFAVNGHPWFLNLQVAGVIVMVLGIAGILVPRRGYGWLRRQTVVSRGPGGQRVRQVRQKRYPPYMMVNPAPPPKHEAFDTVPIPATAQAQAEQPAGREHRSWDGATVTQPPEPGDELVEEYFPE